MSKAPLTRFTCGHTGRDSIPPRWSTASSAFIRVAEARDAPVTEADVKCPACKGKS